MKVLIISYAYPPYNSIGAIRVGKMTRHLSDMGCDIRVITAGNQPFIQSLPTPLDEKRITYTRSFDLDLPARFFMGLRGRSYVKSGFDGPTSSGIPVLKRIYRDLVYIPDSNVGWVPYAVHAAARLLRDWKPDVIYSSGPPFSSLIAASRVSRNAGVPWVAELRDLWSTGTYYPFSGARRRLDALLERRVLRSAAAVVAATDGLARELSSTYGLPTIRILTGCEPPSQMSSGVSQDGPKHISIVYTGTIYRGKRDPALLFEGLREMEPGSVKVAFYGRNLEPVRVAVQDFGLHSCVTVHDAVPHEEALARQLEADLLLLLLWMDARDDGVIPGKLFEYFSMGRPILALGLDTCEGCQLIVRSSAGRVVHTKDALVSALRNWVAQKRASGRLPGIPPEAIEYLSSHRQATLLFDFLEKTALGVPGYVPSTECGRQAAE